MATIKTNGTKAIKEGQELDNLETIDLDNLTQENEEVSLASFELPTNPLGIPKQLLRTSIKVEGLEISPKSGNQFSEDTINSLIALSESLGITPETAISKILDAVFGDNPNLINLYKQIASKHREKLIRSEIEKIEHLRAQKQRELSAIELELQHRTKFPNC